MSQNRILTILKNEGPMKQRELMERMNIQAGSLSEILSKVESGGFVERARCEDDKRNFSLILTEAGRERASVFEAEREALAAELFGTLDDEKKQALGDILEILLQKLREGHCCCRQKADNEKESCEEKTDENA